MGRNIEIKARVQDLIHLSKQVETVADGKPLIVHQEDTFFQSPKGRLKLRRFSAREGELIFYLRANSVAPRESEYVISPTHEPDSLIEVLSRSLGARGVVRKRRRVYMVGQTRIHLDEVEGLGAFVELEVILDPGQTTAQGMQIAHDLMSRLDIKKSDLVPQAYIDLHRPRL